jgi:hypothetical protein
MMKIFVNQCPLCETPLVPSFAGIKFPCQVICYKCGGVARALSDSEYRVLTRIELMELRKKYPVAPSNIREVRDRAVADKWG